MHNIFSNYNIQLTEEEFELFEQFLTLFITYNSHTNLSAIRDKEGIIEKHFIDSLMIYRFAKPEGRLLDIGSGGWFPGIPLKIMDEDLDVVLLDSVGKKVKAMDHFIHELGLHGICSIHERAEKLALEKKHRWQYDLVVSRATAYLPQILEWSVPFLSAKGKIVLYKMPSEEEWKDGEKAMKALGLVLFDEVFYDIGWQDRVLYIFKKA